MADDEYIDARAAADLLGIKRETLYAYVSRGRLDSVPAPGSSRERLYRRSEVERLKARSDARGGEGPVAAAALRWGAPVLETSICRIDEVRGPEYRGRPLHELVESQVAFEQVAELLWTGELPALTQWPAAAVDARRSWDSTEPLAVLRQAVLRSELGDPTRFVGFTDGALRHGRRLIATMVASLAAANRAKSDDSIATAVRLALAADRRFSRGVEAVNTALVVSAEHELNASAFAARVAASTGASAYAAVQAALAAFSGPRHGGVDARLERLLADVEREGATEALLARLRAGEAIPGFGQPLYPAGDPRFEVLWAAARAVDSDATSTIADLVESAASLGLEPPTLDLGLVAVGLACRLRPQSASAMFAIGRTAGWIAHAHEQAAQGFLLRPRAHFVARSPKH